LPKAPEIKRQGREEGGFVYDQNIEASNSGARSCDIYLGLDDLIQLNFEWFQENIAEGVAPEIARNILPQCTYTTLVVSMTVSCAARIYGLRSDYHAQKEIRDFAEIIKDYFVKYPEFTQLIEISKKL
jgi:hypothetical protein